MFEEKGKIADAMPYDGRAIEETLFLESIPGMQESIVNEMKTPAGKCAKEPGW